MIFSTSGNDTINLCHGGSLLQAALAKANTDRKILQPALQLHGSLLGRHDRQLGHKFTTLAFHSLYIGTGSKGRHLNALHMTDNVQTLPSNGAGRAQDRYTFYHKLTP